MERLYPEFNSETNNVDLVVITYEDGVKVDQYILYSLDAQIMYREGFYRLRTDWEVFKDCIEAVDEEVFQAEIEIDEESYKEQLLLESEENIR